MSMQFSRWADRCPRIPRRLAVILLMTVGWAPHGRSAEQMAGSSILVAQTAPSDPQPSAAPAELLEPADPQPEGNHAPVAGSTSSSGGSPPRHFPVPETRLSVAGSESELSQLIKRLRRQHANLKQTQGQAAELKAVQAEIERNRLEHLLHTQRIQGRLTRIRSILKARNNCLDEEEETVDGPSEPAGAEITSHEENQAKTAPTASESDSFPLSSALAVTDAAVDRLSLANNLFAVGNMELAAQIYTELLNAGADPYDKVWIQYQLASCHRRLGDAKQAEKLYRMVAGSKDGPYWAARARWWLANLKKSSRYVERQNRLSVALDELEKQTDEDAAP